MKKVNRVVAVILSFVMVLSLPGMQSMASEVGELQLTDRLENLLTMGMETVSSLQASTSTVKYTGEDGVVYTFNSSTGTITNASITSPTDVVIPSEIDGVAVVAINNSGFYENDNVLSVTFPSSVETIADYTFGLCENLTTVVFETSEETVTDEDGNETTVLKGITTIGEGVFWRCYGITSVTLPETLESISVELFSECTSLTQITFPESVQEIGESGLWGTGLTEVTIPGTVKTIGATAFAECASLETLTIEEGVETISTGAFYECTALEEVNMPDTMTEIESAAFTLCTSLTSFVVPEGITTLSAGILDSCSSLVSVSLPDSLEEINSGAFINCTSLEELNIPDHVTFIGEHAFSSDTSLKSVTLGESVTTMEGYVFFHCYALEEIVIPDSVVYIGEHAFNNCTSLTSVTFGDSLQIIDESAFWFCTALTDLVMPDSLETIGDYAFRGCSSLKTLQLNEGLLSIGVESFKDCFALEELVLPDSLVSLGDYAFQYCNGIKSLVIGSGLTEIGTGVFDRPNSLESIEFRGTVISIGEEAFYIPQVLKEINFPNGLQSIGTSAFAHGNIEKIVIPSSVTEIADEAFYTNCTLTEAWIYSSDVVFGTDVFTWASDDFTIYGYAGSTAEAYAEEYSFNFVDIETMYRDLTVTVCDSEGNVITDGYTITWYDEDGNAVFDSTWQVENVEAATSYTVEIVLNDDMLEYYLQPDTIEFTASSEASLVVTLEDVNWFALNGQVLDADGNGLEETTITVTHQLLGKQYTVVTDAAGSFSVSVPAAAVTLKLQKDGYYSHTENLDLTNVTESSYDYGTYTLTTVASDGLFLTVNLIEAAEEGENADTTVLTSLSRYNVSVMDESGNAVNGYEVQGSKVVFAENTVSEGQTLLISIQDPSGEYQDSDEVSVTLDDKRVGMVSLSMTRKGGFTFPSLDGPAKCSMSVFDSSGTVVLSENVSIGSVYTGLDGGQYTILLVQQSNLIRNITSEDYLSLLGLTEGTDYLRISLMVEDGVITSLDGYEVPEFDESKINYTLSSSITTSKPSGMTVGAAFTVRVAYELDSTKSVDAVSVNVVFPEGVEPKSPQMAQVNGTAAAYIYDAASRTATFSVSGEDSGVVTFYCYAGETAGTYDLNIYLTLTGSIVQPLGTARANIQASSISVPEQTSTDTIIVSGITAPHANVTLYDNGTVMAETTSNAAGSWSTEMPLAEKLYTYSYHYVYAVITSDVFTDGTAMTEEELVIYDERSDIVVKKVTMYNFGHTQQVTEFDFTSASTKEPTYNYNPYYPTFTFKAEIEMSDATRALVENMYVYTVDQYGDRTYVPLTYDKKTGLWVGSYDYTDPYTKPAAVGVGYNMDDSYYEIPVDEDWLEDLEESYTVYYNEIWDYFTDVYEEQFEEICDEDTGIVSVYYVDSSTQERMLAYTYMHYYAELGEDATAEYFEKIGFIALDEEENYWIYVEENETEGNLTGYITCTVDLGASECHVMSYNYSNLYEEESSAVVYSSIDSVNVTDSLTLTSDTKLALLLYASTNDEQSSKYPLPERLTDKMAFKIVFEAEGGSISMGGLATDSFNGLFGVYTAVSGAQVSSGLSAAFSTISGIFSVGNQAYATMEFNLLQKDMNTRAGILSQAVTDTREMMLAKCENGDDKLSSSALLTANKKLSSVESDISDIKLEASYLGAEAVKNAIGSLPVIGTIWNLFTATATLVTTSSFSSIFVQKMEQNYIDYCDQCESLRKEILGIQEYIESNYIDCDEDEDEDTDNETPALPGTGFDDPSGYVYEAVPSNTVEGVTAVVYYKDEDGNAVVWDAEDYNQINYQVTDASGIYQWYVPTGEWKVVFTKDGYETSDTSTVDAANEDGWLPVPPPQIDIAVAIVSTEAPTVESVTAYTDQIEVVFSQYMDMESEDVANVLNAINLTRDGKEVDVTVTAVDAEYNLEGTLQYATRFAIVPADGDISGELILTIDESAENYAGTPLGTSYTSEALTVMERPTSITTPNSMEVVVHEETSISVELNPCIADKTLTVEMQSSDIVSVGETSVVTDENGKAVITVTGELPGTGYIVVTEPISGISATIEVNVVLESEGEDDSAVKPVTVYLEDGTVVTSGMTIPKGSFVTLVTETEGATIRYTVNDTCPCKEAALYYTEPLEITEDTVLRAAAVADGVYSSTIRLELSVSDETETEEETGEETETEETEAGTEKETETEETEAGTEKETETEETEAGTTEQTETEETETVTEEESAEETEEEYAEETDATESDSTENETEQGTVSKSDNSKKDSATDSTNQSGDDTTASSDAAGTDSTTGSAKTGDVAWYMMIFLLALMLVGLGAISRSAAIARKRRAD